jgi:hypothetical protein
MATFAPESAAQRVRPNYLANVVAGIACFLFAAAWYTAFNRQWLIGVGRTNDELMGPGYNPALQYGTALVCAIAMATAISWVTQLTGKQTALRGIQTGALLWLGFELTAWATEYAFEERPLSLLGINGGFWLISMVLMGAIVGAWKKK